MNEEIAKLKEQYCSAKSEEARKEVDKGIQTLANRDPEAFGRAMVQAARDTADRADTLVLKAKMQEILPALSLSFIAKEYFQKSRQWISQRLNGNCVNGKPAQFTEAELETLKFALDDLSKKIGSAGISL